MKAVISTWGEVVLPASFRRRDNIKPGQEFEIQRLDQGEYLLKRVKRIRNQGLVKLLLGCPVKDWFQLANRMDATGEISAPTLG